MCLDVGTKNIGIAITDEWKRFVSPVGSVSRGKGITNDRMSPEALTHLSKCIQQHVDEQRAVGFRIIAFKSWLLSSINYHQELCWDSHYISTAA